MKDDKNDKPIPNFDSPNKKEDEKEDEINDEKKIIRRHKKLDTKQLTSIPVLISLKDKPQKEKIKEENNDDKNFWIPDDHMTNCYKCNSKFISLISRKHHCRICGNIFCKSCLETVCEITIYGGEKKIKVCSYCQQKKIELNKDTEINVDFE